MKVDAKKVIALVHENARRRQWEEMRRYVREQVATSHRRKIVFGRVVERLNDDDQTVA